MHPNLIHREYLEQHKPDAAAERRDGTQNRGLLRKWLEAAMRHWQRRKMIASLEAMNDEVLRDIGICRSEIPRVVDGLSRELPRPRPASAANRDGAGAEAYRQAA